MFPCCAVVQLQCIGSCVPSGAPLAAFFSSMTGNLSHHPLTYQRLPDGLFTLQDLAQVGLNLQAAQGCGLLQPLLAACHH